MTKTITPAELAQCRAAGEQVRLIDVRTPVEYQEVHVEGAENIPLAQLAPEMFGEQKKGDPVYMICRSGARGGQACQRLSTAGINAVNVAGGTAAWEAAGFPVMRSGAKSVSLERQVRIAAGLLVLTGILLGAIVHPAFYCVSAFVGAGLVFAGITDWCGMGLLLARMPWNTVRN